MKQHVIILAEDISEPLDEGIKIFTFHFAKYFSTKDKTNIIFSHVQNRVLPDFKQLPINKFFFSPSFFKCIGSYNSQLLIYIPFSSATSMSFIRLAVVRLFTGFKKTIIVSLQKRRHNYLTRLLIRAIQPTAVIVLSKAEQDYYQKLGMKCLLMPIGVDTEKFTAVNKERKLELRKKLNMPIDSKLILHVGHINKGRNIDSIRSLMSPGFKIVVIGSTRFEHDHELKNKLEKAGYIFVTDFVEDIEEYYQAADIYIFPVKSTTSAIEFPLSVFEAMACNLPVLTTNFGGLQTYLSETACFKYYNNETEMIAKANLLLAANKCKNRDIILSSFSWATVFDKYLADKLKAI